MSIDQTILNNLVCNSEFFQKVYPFFKIEYFSDRKDKLIFHMIQKFVSKYNKQPSPKALEVEIESQNFNGKFSDVEINETLEEIKSYHSESVDIEWLYNKAEEFCQDRAIYNAIMDSISIIDGNDKKRTKGSIPELLSSAIGVCFDNSIGISWNSDLEKRWEYYHDTGSKRVKFGLDILNVITCGGLPGGTLSVIQAPTGVGKSFVMCDWASGHIRQGYNVLYITLELSELEVNKRIDANVLDFTTDQLNNIDHSLFFSRAKEVASRGIGELIVKQYPATVASASHFRQLLRDLRIKRSFIPDVIYIDYINLCSSSRITLSNGTYNYVKAIAEEIRSLAVEIDRPIITATQTGRQANSSSDQGLEDVSESWGLPNTSDFYLGLIQTEELAKIEQVLMKQLKNRFNDRNKDAGKYLTILLGMDKSKMRLYELG